MRKTEIPVVGKSDNQSLEAPSSGKRAVGKNSLTGPNLKLSMLTEYILEN
jgi:hypothetical protein